MYDGKGSVSRDVTGVKSGTTLKRFSSNNMSAWSSFSCHLVIGMKHETIQWFRNGKCEYLIKVGRSRLNWFQYDKGSGAAVGMKTLNWHAAINLGKTSPGPVVEVGTLLMLCSKNVLCMGRVCKQRRAWFGLAWHGQSGHAQHGRVLHGCTLHGRVWHRRAPVKILICDAFREKKTPILSYYTVCPRVILHRLKDGAWSKIRKKTLQQIFEGKPLNWYILRPLLVINRYSL